MTPLLEQADLARVVDQHEQTSEELAVIERFIEALPVESAGERNASMARIIAFLEAYAVRHAQWEERTVMPAVPRDSAAVLVREHHAIEAGVRALASIAALPEPDARLFAARALKLLGALEVHFHVEESTLHALPTASSLPMGLVPAPEKVCDCMTRDVIVARPRDRASDIAARMAAHRLHAVPVLDDTDAIVGLVTREELASLDRRCKSAGADSFDPTHDSGAAAAATRGTAADVMTAATVVLAANEPIAHAALRMVERRAHVAPVVDDKGVVVGILSTLDIARLVARSDVDDEEEEETEHEERERAAQEGAAS